MLSTRVACSHSCLLGEGPLWLEATRELVWVDIKRKHIHIMDIATRKHRQLSFDYSITSLAQHAQGGFIATATHGFVRLDNNFNLVKDYGYVEMELPHNRFNDGKVDSHGRFWAGTMDDNETCPSGSLYSFSDGKWQAHDNGYICTNGPTFSPCGNRLYHTDTFARTIYAFDLDANGQLSNKREFIRINDDEGYPDGMTTDADGNLWVCHWGGWRITQFDPQGNKIRHINMPVANVTSCTFAGNDYRTLYVTSATKGLDESEHDAQPSAGALFSIEMDCRGLPANFFNG